MTSTVTINDKNIATLDITVEANSARKTYDMILKAYSNHVNIAGFRRGKAPLNIVEKYVGKERIEAELRDRIFPVEFQKAVSENKLNIAYNPTIEKFEFKRGQDLKFVATVELKPEVKLSQYKDLEVEYQEYKTPQDAMDKELLEVQRRFSTLNKKDGSASDKDTVVIDFEGYVGDEKIEHGSAKNYSLDLANSGFIPGFAENIVGHSAGEEFDINVKFPSDYHEDKLKDADARFKINLHEVKERIMPELNDELAKKAGKDTLELLKEDIQKYIDLEYKKQNDKLKSDAVFDKISKETNIDIQDTMIDREYSAIVADTKNNLAQSGQSYESFVEHEGKENLEKRFREEALKRIKNSLIVEAIANENKLNVEQKDLMMQINNLAMMYGIPANQLYQELSRNPNSFASISQQILASKVNDLLIESNKFIAK